jgi:PEP-CTERM motif
VNATKNLVCSLVILAGLANPPFSCGGIIYTWHNDDNSPFLAFASLIVNDSAQYQGVITSTDIDFFTFGFGGIPFGASDILISTFPIPISKLDAIPMTQAFGISAQKTVGTVTEYLGVDFNASSFSGPGAAHWDITTSGSHGAFGSGYWSVAGAAVPEPSSLALASLGLVCGIGYIRARKRMAHYM